MTWQTAAYRPEESSPEFLQKLRDLAWLPWPGITTTATMQGFVIAFAVFGDRRAARSSRAGTAIRASGR